MFTTTTRSVSPTPFYASPTLPASPFFPTATSAPLPANLSLPPSPSPIPQAPIPAYAAAPAYATSLPSYQAAPAYAAAIPAYHQAANLSLPPQPAAIPNGAIATGLGTSTFYGQGLGATASQFGATATNLAWGAPPAYSTLSSSVPPAVGEPAVSLQRENEALRLELQRSQQDNENMSNKLRELDAIFKSRLSLLTDSFRAFKRFEAVDKQAKSGSDTSEAFTAALGSLRGVIGKHYTEQELAHLGTSRQVFPAAQQAQQGGRPTTPASPKSKPKSPVSPLRSPTRK